MENIAEQQEAAEAAKAAVEDAQAKVPDAPELADDVVTLPGGLIKGDNVITTAVVQELNGEHEERLGRAMQNGNQYHFLNTLLECGTVQIGEEDPKDTRKLLKELLIGDRDQILLGIRNATYGPEVEITRWRCPSCGKFTDLTLNVMEDIPQKKLENREADRTFEVEMKKGRKAHCELLTGADQADITADEDLTPQERNSIILTKCVKYIEDPNGTQHSMVAWPTLAKKLTITDRRTILEELAKRSPGPRYNGIELTHEECGEEVTLALAIGDLFLL